MVRELVECNEELIDVMIKNVGSVSVEFCGVFCEGCLMFEIGRKMIENVKIDEFVCGFGDTNVMF